jgi:hypothetical protein
MKRGDADGSEWPETAVVEDVGVLLGTIDLIDHKQSRPA